MDDYDTNDFEVEEELFNEEEEEIIEEEEKESSHLNEEAEEEEEGVHADASANAAEFTEMDLEDFMARKVITADNDSTEALAAGEDELILPPEMRGLDGLSPGLANHQYDYLRQSKDEDVPDVIEDEKGVPSLPSAPIKAVKVLRRLPPKKPLSLKEKLDLQTDSGSLQILEEQMSRVQKKLEKLKDKGAPKNNINTTPKGKLSSYSRTSVAMQSL